MPIRAVSPLYGKKQSFMSRNNVNRQYRFDNFIEGSNNEFAKNAEKNKISVIIAGAGGSAHLPGMIASLTYLPVIGVPVESKKLKGLDSLLSIVQMPKGIPVGTVAIGEDGAVNAALLASSIIAVSNKKVRHKLNSLRKKQTRSVKKKPN